MSRERWFFGTLVPETTRARIVDAMEAHIGVGAVRATGFAPSNFHQSFSGRFFAPGDLAALRRAGGRVEAISFTMTLDQFRCGAGASPAHWSVAPSRTNKEFGWLKSSIGLALRTEGLPGECPNSQHVTLSYDAPFAFEARQIPPIVCTIDTLMLLCGGGEPYRYTVAEQWPLKPPPQQLF